MPNIQNNLQQDCNDKLKVCMLQHDIKWQDVTANLNLLESLLLNIEENVDLLILPEMCTSGFSMDKKENIALKADITIKFFEKYAAQKSICIICSFIIAEEDSFYNRLYIFNNNETLHYDKRHLFSLAGENKHFKAGNNKLIFQLKGFKICPIVCYDLRFPVWIRNVNNEYDVLICIANWPKVRIDAWDTLLKARALENQTYAIGVNRIGVDGMNLSYNGHSQAINAKGELIARCKDNKQDMVYAILCNNKLREFRTKFPAFNDADDFKIL